MISDDDKEQFIACYHSTKDKVFSYLMHRLNFNRAICEDLLMDIFLRAYEKFHQFNPKKGSFKNWIFAIAHNHLINYWRNNENKKIASLEDMEEDGFTAATVTIDDNLSQQMDQESIKNVLAAMQEPEREIITLRYLSDLSYEEIGGILKKNPGAVRTSLSRALTRFESIYQKLYPNS